MICLKEKNYFKAIIQNYINAWHICFSLKIICFPFQAYVMQKYIHEFQFGMLVHLNKCHLDKLYDETLGPDKISRQIEGSLV